MNEDSEARSGVDESTLLKGVAELQELTSSITLEEFKLLGPAVRERESRKQDVWVASDRFWFSGTAGLSFSRIEDQATRLLWTRLLVGIARLTSGQDLGPGGPETEMPSGLRQTLDAQSIEGRATTIIERELGSDGWTSATGAWNAACTALLSEHFELELRQSLEAPWLSVFGWTPRERMGRARSGNFEAP